MAALGRTAGLDTWPFFLLGVGVSLELARYCLANNALNGVFFCRFGGGQGK